MGLISSRRLGIRVAMCAGTYAVCRVAAVALRLMSCGENACKHRDYERKLSFAIRRS